MNLSFAHRIALPLALLAVLFLYLAWEVDPVFSRGLIPILVVLAVVYFSAPQINWWWWQRNPPDLSPKLAEALANFHPFYKRLDAAGQRKFRTRTFLFIEGTEWISKNFPDDELPLDVQVIIASQAAALTFHLPDEDFLLKKFERVVVYPKPFMSPEFPFSHSSELFEADGCLILSAEQVMSAFVQPTEHYNPALHEYAKAFQIEHGNSVVAGQSDTPETWADLEKISGMNRQKIETTIGLAGVEPSPVAVHHFYIFGNAGLLEP